MSSAQNLAPLRNNDRKEEKLITVAEAAKLADRKTVTIYAAASNGRLHPVRDSHGHILVKEKEVKALYGDSPVDRRKTPHNYHHASQTRDFNATILSEADSLLGQISVMEASLKAMKHKYSLLEPLVLELRKQG